MRSGSVGRYAEPVRVSYASDLHLEDEDHLTLDGLEQTDVLVLAGDVSDTPAAYTDVLRRLRSVYAGPILFVLGNHEYDFGVFPGDLQAYKSAVSHDPLVFVLEKESVILCGVRFLAVTLWTDFDRGRAFEKCRGEMPDFSRTPSLTPEIEWRAHLDSVQWLSAQFAIHSDLPTIVVSHHAPSYASQSWRYWRRSLSGAFYSDLNAYIKNWKPYAWIHGHVHHRVQTRVGQTLLLAHPWGYSRSHNPRTYQSLLVGSSTPSRIQRIMDRWRQWLA